MKIVESDYWKEALRSCHAGTVSPAEINQPPVEVIQRGPQAGDIHPRHEVHPQSHPVETTPLRKLIEEMPGRHDYWVGMSWRSVSSNYAAIGMMKSKADLVFIFQLAQLIA